MSDQRKIRQHYNSLLGILDVFEKTTPKAEDIELNLVREYERFIEEANKDLSSILIVFNKDDYFSFNNGEYGVFYRSPGIKAHIQRNLGILKTSVEDLSQTPVTDSRSFHFITDYKLRKILERDYQEIQRDIIAASWKSAIILSGGSIEAVLLDLLTKNSSLAKTSSKAPIESDFSKWDLDSLINVAVDIKLVNDQVAKLSHTVREYRNLIHPGREIRSGLKVEPEEAKIAIQVLNILIRELS